MKFIPILANLFIIAKKICHPVTPGNIVKLAVFLVLLLWLGDLVARNSGHQDTKTQRFHEEKENENT